MTSTEIQQYISARNGELSSDEILIVTDVHRNPQINHIIYENGAYQMWDENGTHFIFQKRNW